MNQRYAITVRGIVQGVGFRPYVYRLATDLGLVGFVENHAGSVRIEVEGTSSAVERFLTQLPTLAPPLAMISELKWERHEPRGDRHFVISTSTSDSREHVFISPDVATCDACLHELFDPADRRYRYPFLNCTNCGPRLTIITAAPYDRPNTTMAGFPLCQECRAEYEDPANRRFHAQPIACPVCGPRLQLLDATGQPSETADPLTAFALLLRSGGIGAMKGLGGYHLVCDARNEATVRELRHRKQRDDKPFAIMLQDADSASRFCELSATEEQLLRSPRRPIVLLRKRNSFTLASGIAAGNPYLGVMLPYTPLHHLLLQEVGDIPLVMTSGNRSDEPIAYEDDDAVEQLRAIAEGFLTHNRPIRVRCDDSVSRVVRDKELPIRRSRGYAPQPVPMPITCSQPVLAVGGQLKATFALGRDRHAVLGHHLGDLDHASAYRAFERDVNLYEQLFAFRPELIAHDLHPDYASTQYARRRASELHAMCVPVQHHHAHMASCMAEHGLTGPVIGVAFDGTGFGTDGTIWGGEFLTGDFRGFRREGHLRVVGMPGGDHAIREPWRMALAHLFDAGCAPGGFLVPHTEQRIVRTMLERGFNTPRTSSAGRLFDAVAAIIGVRTHAGYEGQAAIELEWLATVTRHDGSYPFDLIANAPEEPLIVDTRPLILAVSRDANTGVPAGVVARRFHSSMVDMIAAVCSRIRIRSRIENVVLSGGVFLNALLTDEVVDRLTQDGFRAFRHQKVPPNDGGLSLGQIAIAAGTVANPPR